MVPIPVVKLNDGNKIPMLSYGLGTAHLMQPDKHVGEMTLMALQNGYYHLDTAEAYMNETGVGEGIKASGLPREKLFVTAKVVGTKEQDVRAALESSLQKLGLDYVDLYLVHVPFAAGSAAGLQQIWSQMETIRHSGKVRSIGVSNFDKEDLEIILETATVIPAVNQIEFHPYQQHTELLEFHHKHGIATACYSVLSPITAARPGPVDQVYADLAQKYGVSESEIALRWILDQGFITVTTSKRRERLQAYLENLSSFQLTTEEIKQIYEFGKGKKYYGMGLKFMGDIYGNYKSA